MSELQQSQHTKKEDEQEVIEATEYDSSSPKIFNQQNNFHLTQQYDIEKIAKLSETNSELADRLMSLYENQQKHNISMDKRIIAIEEKEQESRIAERPYQRKFAFRSLYFAMGLSIFSLGCSVYFASKGQVALAIISISIPIGVAVANMLGFKAAGQNLNKKSDSKDVSTKEET